MLLRCMQPDLCGILPVVRGKLGDLQQDAMQWPNSLKQCTAVCNSLNYVNKHKLVGDVADYAAFTACEARFLVRKIPSAPPALLWCDAPSCAVLCHAVLCCQFLFELCDTCIVVL